MRVAVIPGSRPSTMGAPRRGAGRAHASDPTPPATAARARHNTLGNRGKPPAPLIVAGVSSARTVTRRPPAGARRKPAPRSGNRRPAARRPPSRRAPARRRTRSLRRYLQPATLWPLLLIALVTLLAFAWDADQQNTPQMRTAPC